MLTAHKDNLASLPPYLREIALRYTRQVLEPLLKDYATYWKVSREEAREETGWLEILEEDDQLLFSAERSAITVVSQCSDNAGGLYEAVFKTEKSWLFLVLINNDKGMAYLVPSETLSAEDNAYLEANSELPKWK